MVWINFLVKKLQITLKEKANKQTNKQKTNKKTYDFLFKSDVLVFQKLFSFKPVVYKLGVPAHFGPRRS